MHLLWHLSFLVLLNFRFEFFKPQILAAGVWQNCPLVIYNDLAWKWFAICSFVKMPFSSESFTLWADCLTLYKKPRFLGILLAPLHFRPSGILYLTFCKSLSEVNEWVHASAFTETIEKPSLHSLGKCQNASLSQVSRTKAELVSDDHSLFLDTLSSPGFWDFMLWLFYLSDCCFSASFAVSASSWFFSVGWPGLCLFRFSIFIYPFSLGMSFILMLYLPSSCYWLPNDFLTVLCLPVLPPT